MSAPEEPLRSVLVGDATEQEIRNVWQTVQRQRARAPKQGLRSHWRAGGLGVAVLAAFCLWFVATRGPMRKPRSRTSNPALNHNQVRSRKAGQPSAIRDRLGCACNGASGASCAAAS